MSLSTTQFVVPNATVGSTSAAETFTVINSGTAPLHVTNTHLIFGTLPITTFAVASDTCSNRLIARGTSCTVG